MQQYYVFKLYSWVMFYRKYPSALSSTGTIICGELEKSKCLVANSWIARAKARCISKKKTKNKKHVWHIMLPGSLSLVKSKSRPLNLCIGLKSVCKCCKQVESTYSFFFFFETPSPWQLPLLNFYHLQWMLPHVKDLILYPWLFLGLENSGKGMLGCY